MLRFPTHEAKAKGPVEILISSRQLQEVMERSTVDLDRSCTTIKGGGLKEDDLVEGVGRHVNLMKTHRRTKTPFYTTQDKGITLKRKITMTLLNIRKKHFGSRALWETLSFSEHPECLRVSQRLQECLRIIIYFHTVLKVDL